MLCLPAQLPKLKLLDLTKLGNFLLGKVVAIKFHNFFTKHCEEDIVYLQFSIAFYVLGVIICAFLLSLENITQSGRIITFLVLKRYVETYIFRKVNFKLKEGKI